MCLKRHNTIPFTKFFHTSCLRSSFLLCVFIFFKFSLRDKVLHIYFYLWLEISILLQVLHSPNYWMIKLVSFQLSSISLQYLLILSCYYARDTFKFIFIARCILKIVNGTLQLCTKNWAILTPPPAQCLHCGSWIKLPWLTPRFLITL